MELYLEKAFLDDFYISIDIDSLTKTQEILVAIFKEYGSVKKYIDIEFLSKEKLDMYKKEHELMAYLWLNGAPNSIKSVKKHFFENETACKQTIIFTHKSQDWFKEAERKGALCFSMENYNNKINTILTECHIKIDLSEGFKGWSLLSNFGKLPVSEVLISDNYVLLNKERQKITDNLIPLLENILNRNASSIKTNIFTLDLNPLKDNFDKNKEKAKKVSVLLNSSLAHYKNKYTIWSSKQSNKIKMHDRILLSDFYIIDSGIGFNLMPSKNSNSQIIGETIFSKYTYDRLRNLKNKYVEYQEKLKRLETSEFKYYPS